MQLMKYSQDYIGIYGYVIEGPICIVISNYRISMISTCTANLNSGVSTIAYTEVEHCLI